MCSNSGQIMEGLVSHEGLGGMTGDGVVTSALFTSDQLPEGCPYRGYKLPKGGAASGGPAGAFDATASVARRSDSPCSGRTRRLGLGTEKQEPPKKTRDLGLGDHESALECALMGGEVVGGTPQHNRSCDALAR